jgi:hypothetical protein
MRMLEMQVAAERKEQKQARWLAAYYERKQAKLARASEPSGITVLGRMLQESWVNS